MENFINNYEIYRDGSVKRVATNPLMGKSYVGRFLKQESCKNGYKRVTLCDQGKTKRFLVHRLVAMVYLPNPDNLPQVNHKDGNKCNNSVENLEWVSAKDNNLHSINVLNRNTAKGEDRPEAKLTEAAVRDIRERVDVNMTHLAREFGVSRSAMQDVVHRRTWKHVI